MFYDRPILFEPNYVRRIYLGGQRMRGISAPDLYPEHWLCSAVHALNEPSMGEYEGVSRIRGGEGMYFSDALKKYPDELLGGKPELRVLVKIIDSAVRLPVQAHPDKSFSRRYFSSDHGKEEAWYIIDADADSKIYYGFKDGVTKEELSRAVDASETDPDAMTALVDSFTPKPGDVVYIPSRLVHAIGAGVTLIEVQEPTDFTIQPERFCADHRLSDSEMYLGLTKEQALGCFDMDKRYPAPLKPRLISDSDGVRMYELIGREQTDSFAMRLIESDGGSVTLCDPAAVCYLLKGGADSDGLDLKETDCFFIPAAAAGKIKITGAFSLIECF